MRSRLRSSLVIFISLILSLYGGLSNNSSVKAAKGKANQSNEQMNPRILKLNKNVNWQALSKFWKQLNSLTIDFSPKDGPEALSPGASSETESENNLKTVGFLRKGYSDVNGYLDALVKANLLSSTERSFLIQLIQERFNYLQFKVGLIMCYEPSLAAYKIWQSRDDLEIQYDIIEKLYKQQKINPATFENARQRIIEDINFVQKSDNASEKPVDKELVDILIYLNK